jgi:hypothetical protein
MTNEFTPEPNESPTESKLSDEFITLGKNLVDILRTAWDRPERRKLQDEIADGLSSLAATLRKDAQAVADSPVSQRIKTEVGDFGDRVRSGQLEYKIRDELLSALHTVNTELEKVNTHLASAPDEEPTEETIRETVSEMQTGTSDETVSEAPADTPSESTPPTESPVEDAKPED